MNDVPENAAQSAVQDDAAARLKQDLTAVKNDVAHLTQQIVDAVNALAAVAQNQGRRSLRQARANIDQAVSGASDRAGAVTIAAQDAASSVAELAGGSHPGAADHISRARYERRLRHRRRLAPLTGRMFEKVYDRWKSEASGAVRLYALAAACAAAAAIALGFVCAAAFVFVLNRYGLVDACLMRAPRSSLS